MATTRRYITDPNHTYVRFGVLHFGTSTVRGRLDDVQGTIDWADDPAARKAEFNIDLRSLNTGSKHFNEHLSSADFFDVAQFPQATFKSTSVTANGGNKFTVVGDLTIKNTTKPVTLDVTLNGAGPHPMMKKQAIGFDATTTLKRSDFGLDMAAPAVSDEVSLRITTEGTIADAPAAADAATQG